MKHSYLQIISFILIIFGSVLCLMNFVSPHKIIVQEPVQVPYTDMESRENAIGSVENRNLGGGQFIYWSLNIESGKSVSVSWSADGCLYIFILTENQFQQFRLLGTTSWYTAFKYCNSGTLTKTIENTDTYYIAVSNPWVLTTIKLYSAQSKLIWQEPVTRYRTKYIPKEVTDQLYLYSGLSIIGIALGILVVQTVIKGQAKHQTTPTSTI